MRCVAYTSNLWRWSWFVPLFSYHHRHCDMCFIRQAKQKNLIYCTFYQTWVVLPPLAVPSSLGSAFKFNTIFFRPNILLQKISFNTNDSFRCQELLFIAFYFKWIGIGKHICMRFSWWKHLGNLNKMRNTPHLFTWKIEVIFLVSLDDFQEEPSNEDVSFFA